MKVHIKIIIFYLHSYLFLLNNLLYVMVVRNRIVLMGRRMMNMNSTEWSASPCIYRGSGQPFNCRFIYSFLILIWLQFFSWISFKYISLIFFDRFWSERSACASAEVAIKLGIILSLSLSFFLSIPPAQNPIRGCRRISKGICDNNTGVTGLISQELEHLSCAN